MVTVINNPKFFFISTTLVCFFQSHFPALPLQQIQSEQGPDLVHVPTPVGAHIHVCRKHKNPCLTHWVMNK